MSPRVKTVKNTRKRKYLKISKEKYQVIFQVIPIKLTVDFSAGALQTKTECNNVPKENNYQLRILCLARLFCRNEVEIKTLQDKQNLRKFMTIEQHYKQYISETYIQKWKKDNYYFEGI